MDDWLSSSAIPAVLLAILFAPARASAMHLPSPVARTALHGVEIVLLAATMAALFS